MSLIDDAKKQALDALKAKGAFLGNAMAPATSLPLTDYNKSFTGDYAGFLGSQFTDVINAGGMDKNLKDLLSIGTKKISGSAGQARNAVSESFASSGFKGGGANLYNQLFTSEADQIAGLTANVGQVASQQKNQALASLLGLTEFQGGQQLNATQLAEQQRQYEQTFAQNVKQFGLEYALKQRELDMKQKEIDSQGSFGNVLGSILGVGVGAITGGVGTALGGKIGDKLFG